MTMFTHLCIYIQCTPRTRIHNIFSLNSTLKLNNFITVRVEKKLIGSDVDFSKFFDRNRSKEQKSI